MGGVQKNQSYLFSHLNTDFFSEGEMAVLQTDLTLPHFSKWQEGLMKTVMLCIVQIGIFLLLIQKMAPGILAAKRRKKCLWLLLKPNHLWLLAGPVWTLKASGFRSWEASLCLLSKISPQPQLQQGQFFLHLIWHGIAAQGKQINLPKNFLCLQFSLMLHSVYSSVIAVSMHKSFKLFLKGEGLPIGSQRRNQYFAACLGISPILQEPPSLLW